LPNLLLVLPLLALQSQTLTANELSLGGAMVFLDHPFAGAELGFAHRPSSESRIALAVAGGAANGDAAVRAQVTIQLLINPLARSGTGVYAGLGAAFAGQDGVPGQGFLAVLVGVEAAPGGRKAWYAELGFCGGVRAAVGWRLRKFPRWWSAP
jgi:hypothetical protein